MGLKIGRALKKVVKGAVKVLPSVVTGFATGGPIGAVVGGLVGTAQRKAAFTGGSIGAGVPSIQEVTGVPALFPAPSFRPMAQVNGGLVVPAGGALPAVVGGLTRSVASAIIKLAGSLGLAVTAQNLARVGLRLWRSVTALARRYPGVSILTFLTGLGLTLDEAGEFLFWGQTRKRRRRRGISGRDISITRRTLRKLDMFRARLGPRRRSGGRRGGRGGGVVIAQQQD